MIPYGRHAIDEDDIRAVAEVLRGGMLTQGPKVAEFERAVAAKVGARYAVAVANGTAALHLAALAADLGPGDVAITSPNTFVASANCAHYAGARAAFADIDPDTLNLDPAALRAACKAAGKIKAIIPVHFAGLPCDMAAIKAVADETGAMVIEDASHALGASYADGSPVGNGKYSAMTVFSFHPVKIIAAGEGGMITTNNDALYRRLLRLRSHGISKGDYEFLNPEEAYQGDAVNPWYYEMQELGYNYRITDIHCALALSQLGKVDRFIARRRAIAARYDAAFAGLTAVRPTQTQGRARSSHHLYVLRFDFEALGLTRGEVMRRLAAQGVGSQVHYIPVHYQPYYRELGHARGGYPHAERYYEQALTIPLFFGMRDAEVEQVITAVQDIAQPVRRSAAG